MATNNEAEKLRKEISFLTALIKNHKSSSTSSSFHSWKAGRVNESRPGQSLYTVNRIARPALPGTTKNLVKPGLSTNSSISQASSFRTKQPSVSSYSIRRTTIPSTAATGKVTDTKIELANSNKEQGHSDQSNVFRTSLSPKESAASLDNKTILDDKGQKKDLNMQTATAGSKVTGNKPTQTNPLKWTKAETPKTLQAKHLPSSSAVGTQHTGHAVVMKSSSSSYLKLSPTKLVKTAAKDAKFVPTKPHLKWSKSSSSTSINIGVINKTTISRTGLQSSVGVTSRSGSSSDSELFVKRNKTNHKWERESGPHASQTVLKEKHSLKKGGKYRVHKQQTHQESNAAAARSAFRWTSDIPNPKPSLVKTKVARTAPKTVATPSQLKWRSRVGKDGRKQAKESRFSLKLKAGSSRKRPLQQNVWISKSSLKLDRRDAIKTRRSSLNAVMKTPQSSFIQRRRSFIATQYTLKAVNRAQTQASGSGISSTKRKSGNIVMIRGVPYHSSSNKLSKTNQDQDLKSKSTTQAPSTSVSGARFIMGANMKSLKRIKTTGSHQNESPLSKVSQTRHKLVRRHSQSRNSLNRIAASRILQRSVQNAAKYKRKGPKEYCMYYNRFGKCKKGEKCPYIHDPSKIAVCTRFLRGTCKLTEGKCQFSHKVDKDKMPVCQFFLQGKCSNEDCPYSHVNVGQKAAVCQDFIRGYCPLGQKCKKKHVLECEEFNLNGKCPNGEKCRLYHRKKKPATKRKRPAEEMSGPPDSKLPKQETVHTADDDSFLPLNQSTGAEEEESADITNLHMMETGGGAEQLQIRPSFLLSSSARKE